MIRLLAMCGLLLFSLSACGSSGDTTREEIDFPSAGALGIFDPSLADDPITTDRIWMSYSSVASSATYSQNPAISTRLAYSNNAGETWTDSGIIINQSTDEPIPPANALTWEHEVSSIIYDPGAPLAEKWKCMWHRYVVSNNNRLFEHGWIAMKSASTPAGLALATEHKLFTGSIYDVVNDTTIGPPECKLDELHPDLNGCVAFTEPGLYATPTALYAVLSGVEPSSPTKGRIILLKLTHSTGTWEYLGTLLFNSTDGPAFGYDGFTAAALYNKNGSVYCIATPYHIVMAGPIETHKYSGTFVFRITDLDNAQIERSAGKPVTYARIFGTSGSHNGAAGYLPTASASGIIYSELLEIGGTPHFAIFKSGINP
jgi:hypothetical protein